MSEPRLGMIISDSEATRDAIHVAILPVSVAHKTWPGNHVGMDSLGRASEEATPKIGIIDPFMTGAIYPGVQCWVLMYPGTAFNLKHTWEHALLTDPKYTPPPKAPEDAMPENPSEYGDGCRNC